jgi:hypothetical protein
VISTIGQYFDQYPERVNITEDDLLAYFLSLYPNSKEKEAVTNMTRTLKETHIENPEVLVNALNVLVYRHFVGNILTLSASGLDQFDPEIPNKIIEEVGAYHLLAGSVVDPKKRFARKTLKEILQQEKSINMHWRNPVVQKALGNPRPGRLHHVFGHVHSGKSAFMISEATNFAYQIFKQERKDNVVYITNEEGKDQLLIRLFASFLNQPIETIEAFPERAEEAYTKHGGNNILIADDVHTIGQIQRDVHDVRPLIMFIDQGTKILPPGKKQDAKHEQLRMVYNEYRKLVVQYQFDIVACGQASDESRPKRWLSLRDCDGSKVGLPGELDVAIGIGQDGREGMEMVRYFHTCKNRYTGRFEKDTLTIDPQRVRFT